MNEIFNIDYSSHPGYKDIQLNLFEKIFYSLFFYQVAFTTLVSILWMKKYPLLDNANTPKVLQDFSEQGFMQLKDDDLVNSLSTRLSICIQEVKTKVRKIAPSTRTFGDCIKGYELNNNPGLFKEIENELLSNFSVKTILTESFQDTCPKLVYFQIHVNQEDDEYVFKHNDSDIFDEDMNFFHVDTNLNTLKVMIYFTDVEEEQNGAFEYVSGSHKYYSFENFFKRKVVRRMGAYRRDEIGKKKLLALPESYRVKNEFSDFPRNSDLGNFIKRKKVTCIGKSNIILFNPLGIHRGGRVKKGVRIAAQLVFCPDNSWRTG